jgi:hypothetical protein
MPAKRKRCDSDENLVDYESVSFERNPSKRSASNTQFGEISQNINYSNVSKKSFKTSSNSKFKINKATLFHKLN